MSSFQALLIFLGGICCFVFAGFVKYNASGPSLVFWHLLLLLPLLTWHKAVFVERKREIVSELDRYSIGQKDAKRAVAIALRNRWRRLQ